MELEKPYTRLSHVSDTCISEQPKEIACFTPNMGFYVGPWGLLSSNNEEPHINQNTGWFQPWFHWWSPGQASERQHPHRGQRRSGRKLPWDCSEFRGENSTETLVWNHAFFLWWTNFSPNQFVYIILQCLQCVYVSPFFAASVRPSPGVLTDYPLTPQDWSCLDPGKTPRCVYSCRYTSNQNEFWHFLELIIY